MALIHEVIPVSLSTLGWFYVLAGIGLTYAVASRIYIAFLHPLSKYPGPRLWALSTIPHDIHNFQGNLPRAVCKLHDKYGPIVRVLPNQLSYTTEEAWNDIYGKFPGKPQLIKKRDIVPGPPRIIQGLFTTESDVDHARMRRNFSYAFSERALREQEPIMKPYFDLLIQRLRENCGPPVDIAMWYNATTFDIVGDLLFGESYDCLNKSTLHMWITFIFAHIKVIRILELMTRIAPLDKLLLLMLPKSMKQSGMQFRQFHASRVNQRLERDSNRLDFMSHVQKTYNTPEGMHIEEIRQTCNVFVVAGSETTATLLSGVTYFLLKNPSKYQKLVKEIRQAFNNDGEINITSVHGLKYESAVLEEGLRCFPPVAGSLARVVPPDGHVIAGQFVPGKSLVAVSQWSAYHSSSNFKDPYEFVPERWLGDPKYKDDKRKVLQPFSVGPRNCIGQNLAYAEMRVILTRILWNFDIELCEESQDWIDRLEVYTLWKKQPLMVKMIPVREV